jgi:epoxide hydrolase-like predicted phosphatase
MAIKAVIFDFGGVLVRTVNQAGRERWEKVLNLPHGELSKTVFDSEVAVNATLGKVDEQKIWEYVGQKYHLPPEEVNNLAQDFWSGDRLDMELVDFLRSLRPKYKTAILSNAWSGARLTFTHKFQLDNAVDQILISAEEGLAKPDPQIYHLAAERLGVQPPEAIFVDDFPQNVQAASAAGLKGIQFITTPQVIADIRNLLNHS